MVRPSSRSSRSPTAIDRPDHNSPASERARTTEPRGRAVSRETDVPVKLIEFSTRRPVSIFIFAVAIVVFGAIAFNDLATDLLPDITYPSLTVQTSYEGAAPLEVESLITRPVENAVGVVNNVVRVVSSSRADNSDVTLEFSWGTDMDLAALDVRERLDVLRLPADAERPVLLRFDPSLDPILRLGTYGNDDLVRLRLIAEERIKRDLERIEGVAAVVVSGGLEEEILVELDERRIANLGLASRIRRAVRSTRPSSSSCAPGTPATKMIFPPSASISVARKVTPSASASR